MATLPSIHPASTLRTLAIELEATLVLARADPSPDPIHRLRVLTRRVEAQLALLRLLDPGAPRHRKLRNHLRRLRRAAGSVRDLDVQSHALEHHLPAAPDAAAQAAFALAAHRLQKHLAHRRHAATADLLRTLRRHSTGLARHLEALQPDTTAASAASGPSATPAHVATLLRDWYTHTASEILPPGADPIDLADDDLHDLRKAAKLARYLAEGCAPPTVPGTKPAPLPHALRSLARHFEAIQDAGGTWHDSLTLAELAHHRLGRNAPLTGALHAETARALAAFQRALTQPHP